MRNFFHLFRSLFHYPGLSYTSSYFIIVNWFFELLKKRLLFSLNFKWLSVTQVAVSCQTPVINERLPSSWYTLFLRAICPSILPITNPQNRGTKIRDSNSWFWIYWCFSVQISLPTPESPVFLTNSWREKRWIHAFTKNLDTKWMQITLAGI